MYTRAELATRAGVDVVFVDRLCKLGLLDSSDDLFSEGDMRRARILHALDAAGMPIDLVGEAIRRGVADLGFVDDPAYSLFSGLTGETFAGVAARRTAGRLRRNAPLG